MRKKLIYLRNAAFFWLGMKILGALPLDAASALGGFLGRRIGPHTRLTRFARRNLELVFPEKSAAERERILRGMWDHLGRVAAEFPHLAGEKLLARVQIIGQEHLPSPGQAVIFISGHFGNWELTYPLAHRHGIPVALVYRHANHAYVDRMMLRVRQSHSRSLFPKGMRGAARLAGAIKRGESLAMLIDQKMNEGIAVPFFGMPAMTAPAFAQLSARFGMPVIPARVVRTRGCHFVATVYPPMQPAEVPQMLAAANAMLEGWIREYPEQWLWVHRRWPKEWYPR